MSVVPASACSHATQLAAYSTVTGRLTRRLGAFSIPMICAADPPAVQTGGRLLVTDARTWLCMPRYDRDLECPQMQPNSCANEVLSAIPGVSGPQLAFTVPGRYQIGAVVPGPDGRWLAFARTPCTVRNAWTGIILRAADGARERQLFGRDNACDDYGRPAFSAAGKELAFVYEESLVAAGPPAPAAGDARQCQLPVRNQIVTVATVASARQVRRIPAPPGCAYMAVSFDPRGLAAVAGCGTSRDSNTFTIPYAKAYLLRLSRAGRTLQRWPLEPEPERALITPEPGSGSLLITQDVPANSGVAEADWVWELSGRHLRLVRRYRAWGAAQVLAVGW